MADLEEKRKRKTQRDERIMKEARERLKRSDDWEGEANKNWLEDKKFANADARNHDQWPSKFYDLRDGQDKPCLTINETRVHNKLVINAALKNQSSIKINATGGGATYDSAQMFQALVRRIEYISNATVVYKRAITDQVNSGLGYATLETAYMHDKTFDQDIYIRPILDPTCVRMDCDSKQPDGTDANWGFVFQPIPKEDADRKYPECKGRIGSSTLGVDGRWLNDKYVLECMYYRRTQIKDKLITYVEPASGQRVTKRLSKIENKELINAIVAQIENGEIDGRIREVEDQKVQWFLIIGDVIVKEDVWAGRYVPIVPLNGECVILDGKIDRKGLTRYMIDPQRGLNYYASGGVEWAALQSRTQWGGPARAFEGQEQWKNTNLNNYAFLQWNDYDEDAAEGAKVIPAPQKLPPPAGAPIYQEGVGIMSQFMMATSGQFQSTLGEPSNERSGRAINERKVQGEVATYDFSDNQGDFYRGIGVHLVDLIPKIYDTERILTITHENGDEEQIKLDPRAKDAVAKAAAAQGTAEQIVFNPNVGTYDVVADPGPNYATQRQEAWNAISMILQHNMELAGIIGDLLFKNGDFAGASDLAERMRREIAATKPYLFNDEESPGIQMLQQKTEQLGRLNAELMTKLAEAKLAEKDKSEKNNIAVYQAHTDRLDVLENQPGGERAFQALIQKAVTEALGEHLKPQETGESSPAQSNGDAVDFEQFGARKAQDGKFYVPDLGRPGKYMMVE